MMFKVFICFLLSFKLFAFDLLEEYNQKRKIFVRPDLDAPVTSYLGFLEKTEALKLRGNHCKKCIMSQENEELAKLYFKTYLKTYDLENIKKSLDHHMKLNDEVLQSLILNSWSHAGKIQYGNSYFLSQEEGEWIYDPGHENSLKLNLAGQELYDAFWDIKPIVLLGALDNYLRKRDIPLIADMNAGEGKDYASLLGYYFLPVRKEDFKDSFSYAASKVYPVTFRIKLLFMKDSFEGFPKDWSYRPDNSTDVRERRIFQGLYERFLKFVVYFEKPVELSENGSKLKGGGNIKGEGIWSHRDEKIPYGNLKKTHPDFVFFPSVSADTPGEHPLSSDKILNAQTSDTDVHAYVHKHVTTEILLSRESEAFDFIEKLQSRDDQKTSLKSFLENVFHRRGIGVDIYKEEIQFNEGSIKVKASFFGFYDQKKLHAILRESGLRVD